MTPRKINNLDVNEHLTEDPGIELEHEDSEEPLLQYLMRNPDTDPADIRQILSAS